MVTNDIFHSLKLVWEIGSGLSKYLTRVTEKDKGIVELISFNVVGSLVKHDLLQLSLAINDFVCSLADQATSFIMGDNI